MIIGIDHVQSTVPADAVADARAFYCQLLGLREVEKPAALRGDSDFRSATAKCMSAPRRASIGARPRRTSRMPSPT